MNEFYAPDLKCLKDFEMRISETTKPDILSEGQPNPNILSLRSPTVTEVLGRLETKFRITTLPSFDMRAEYGYRQLARLHNGQVITFECPFPNRAGIDHYFALHRNNESQIYELGNIGVRFVDNVSGKPSELSLKRYILYIKKIYSLY